MSAPIPENYLDLFKKKAFGSFTTLSSDGSPHTTPVWVDYQNGDVWVNETSTDHTYRYITAEKRWIAYPMPLTGTFTRDLTITKEGYVCMSNNPEPLASLEGGVTELICIHPEGDVKVEARAD